MREIAVVGIGMTKFGISEKSNIEMFAEAALDSMMESNIRAKDIEALYLGNVLGDFEEGQINMAPMAAVEIGIPSSAPATRFEGACASFSVAIIHAALGVAYGMFDIVLAGGTERTTAMGTPLVTRTFAMGSDPKYESPAGITFPGVFGMGAHLYSKKYNIPLDVSSVRLR